MNATVNIHYKRFVLAHGVKYLQKSLLPCVICFLFFKRLAGVLHARPFDKVIYVLEMIIKRHTVYSAILGDIVYRYFCQRFFEKKIFERLFQRALCYLRHIFHLRLR